MLNNYNNHKISILIHSILNYFKLRKSKDYSPLNSIITILPLYKTTKILKLNKKELIDKRAISKTL